MAKVVYELSNFLSDVHPDFESMICQIHDYLVNRGCSVSIQPAKSGHVVSFLHPATKKTVANFVVRKKGPSVRIYGDNCPQYQELLEELPNNLQKQVEKSSVCRRLLDSTKCNARCPMGYVFTLNGVQHKKCRYNCFLFAISPDNTPHILSMLDRELQARSS